MQASATEYKFDAAERLTEIVSHRDTETQRFIYSYSPTNGMVESVSNTVSGITCSYAYNIMDQVTNITYRTSGGSLIRSLDYAYNEAGMITNKTTAGGSQTAEVGYIYDCLDRLLSESRSTSLTNSTVSTTSFSYDLAGNRLTKTVDGIGTAYTLETGNRLASAGTVGVIDVEGSSTEPIGTDDSWGELWVSNITAQAGWMPEIDGTDFLIENLPVEPGTNQIVAAIRDQAGNTDYTTNTVVLSATNQAQTFAYNAAGCMTNLNGVSLEWDERYRLTSVSSVPSVVNYTHDVLGRRVSRTETSNSNPQTTNCTYFVYNGNQVVADLDENGSLLRTYVWGTGIDNLLCFTDHTTSNTYYAVKDHQNTVIALVDESGTVVESYEYSAYGEILDVKDGSGNSIGNQQSAIGNRYTFQGREIDWSTGLIYFRARWYDPETGRWLSKDPIGIEGGLNLYAFCGNNPVMFIDPTGLCQEDIDKLRDAFDKKIAEWIKDGKRLPGNGEWFGWANNLLGFYGKDYMGCWDQASLMAVYLTTGVGTEAIWSFREESTTFPPHHWVILDSSNPDDSSIRVDPWKNEFEVLP